MNIFLAQYPQYPVLIHGIGPPTTRHRTPANVRPSSDAVRPPVNAANRQSRCFDLRTAESGTRGPTQEAETGTVIALEKEYSRIWQVLGLTLKLMSESPWDACMGNLLARKKLQPRWTKISPSNTCIYSVWGVPEKVRTKTSCLACSNGPKSRTRPFSWGNCSGLTHKRILGCLKMKQRSYSRRPKCLL